VHRTATTINRKEVPNLADVGATKFLGAVYGIDAAKVEAELTKTLRTQLERVDAANVGGAVKLLIYNDYVVPSWKYRLAVQKELATRGKELRTLEDIAASFLKKWAKIPRSATRAILYSGDGLGLTPFTKAALVTQIEVLEQAAKGGQELRRAIAEQVTRHDGREDGMSPIAAAFAIWIGRELASGEPAEDGTRQRKGRWRKIRDMAKRARCTVAEWRVEARVNASAAVERQGRHCKKGKQRKQMAEETLLAEAQTNETEESAEQWDAGNK